MSLNKQAPLLKAHIETLRMKMFLRCQICNQVKEYHQQMVKRSRTGVLERTQTSSGGER
jgi:hypothetical protein